MYGEFQTRAGKIHQFATQKDQLSPCANNDDGVFISFLLLTIQRTTESEVAAREMRLLRLCVAEEFAAEYHM